MNDTPSVSLGHAVGSRKPRFLNESERARHLYAVGRTGSGKTTLLRSIFLQDIVAGRGGCLIDPHGDNAQAIADSIPRHRLNDVIYFDASDRSNPIGLNLLENLSDADDAELIASEVVTMFKGLFRDSWGPWLEYLLKNTLLTLMLQRNVPVSLVSVQRMLDDKDYRERMIAGVKDPVVRGFWEKYFAKLTKRVELELTSSTLNKVGKFALAPVIRNIVGQWRSGFDMQQVMDQKKILIVNLAKGRIGEDNANFIGSMIVSKIVSTALRRSAISETERVPFYLNIDEFQNFTTKEIPTIVSEARKYALSLTVAHQNFSQIPTDIVDSIIKDAGTLISFKVGFEDNDRLAKAFFPVTSESLGSTSDGCFYERTGDKEPLVIRGHHPDELDVFRNCSSFKRVQKNSRWRYSRPRDTVEREFNRWYRRSFH